MQNMAQRHYHDCLTRKAIIRDGENAFIYAAKNDSDIIEFEFPETKCSYRASDNGFTAVKLIDTIPEGMQIVTKEPTTFMHNPKQEN